MSYRRQSRSIITSYTKHNFRNLISYRILQKYSFTALSYWLDINHYKIYVYEVQQYAQNPVCHRITEYIFSRFPNVHIKNLQGHYSNIHSLFVNARLTYINTAQALSAANCLASHLLNLILIDDDREQILKTLFYFVAILGPVFCLLNEDCYCYLF